MEKVYITLEKFKLLKQHVKELKSIKRKDIADKLSQFRDSVDLVEDSSYTEILQEQAHLEEEIDQIEFLMQNASIIKERKSVKIRLGSLVTMTNMLNRRKLQCKIVGPFDVDPINNDISHESPLGKALIGKRKGDIVEIAIPSGISKYKILEID